MNIVDSSGWVEFFANGVNADFFAGPIGDTETLLTPTICVYEVLKRVILEYGDERALEVIGGMFLGEIIDLDRQTAIEAVRLSIDLKLAMADSIILATAQAYEAILWTQDAHFKDIEGVRYIEKVR
jgi:predicted nucleic acid-binding protein